MKVWCLHGSDEGLWSVLGVSKEVGDTKVVDWLRVSIVATMGAVEMVDW